MIPRSLSIHGLTCLRDVKLDLDELPAGLISVQGENGAGKTTILECMGPAALYRRFPSRDSRRGLLDVATQRDAHLDVVWDYAGQEVRVLHQADPDYSNGRGKAEAFLWLDGVPAADGKLPDYDRVVQGLFPTAAVVLAGAYSAPDGIGSFANLSIADRRDLFAELLGLAELRELTSRARDHRKRLDAAAGELDRRAQTLTEQEARGAELRDRLPPLQARYDSEVAAIAPAEEQARALDAELAEQRAELQVVDGKRADIRTRRAALRRERDDLKRREGDVQHRVACLPDFSDERVEQLEADAARCAELTAEREPLREQWREASQAQRAAEVTAQELEGRAKRSAAGAAEVKAELDDGDWPDLGLPELREQLQAVAVVESGARELRNSLIYRGRHPDSYRDELDRGQRVAQLLDNVPCEGRALLTAAHLDAERDRCHGIVQACREEGETDHRTMLYRIAGGAPDDNAPELPPVDCGACELLAEATTARDAEEGLLKGLAEAEEAVLAFVNADAGLHVAIEDRTTAERLVYRGERREELRAKHRELAVRAQSDQDHAQEAIEAREQARRRPIEIDERGKAITADLRELQDAPTKLREVLAAKASHPALVEQLEGIRMRLQVVEGDLEDLVSPPEPTELINTCAELESKAALAWAHRDGLVTHADEARDLVAGVQAVVDELGDLEEQREQLDQARVDLGLRRRGFVLVEQATGRDGIQALEIDAAGPEVSSIASELLSACYGGRFALELRTVRPAEGARKQREVFDLVVHDGRGGDVRPFEQLSTGEKVICDEALKLSIAVFSARRSGAISTLWRDEADGKLSPANAAAYPRMLRAALDLGAFHRVFFVSHRPEVQDQADARIVVAGGTARIEV